MFELKKKTVLTFLRRISELKTTISELKTISEPKTMSQIKKILCPWWVKKFDLKRSSCHWVTETWLWFEFNE